MSKLRPPHEILRGLLSVPFGVVGHALIRIATWIHGETTWLEIL